MGECAVDVECTGKTATLVLNRPKIRNAIGSGMLRDLEAAIGDLERDVQVRVVFVKGAGGILSAGGDIREMRDLRAEDARDFLELGHRVLARLEHSRLVFIAVIEGVAFGGGTELALACDLRIADVDAKLGLPEVRIGLFPGWGGTQRLARLVGQGAANQLILAGAPVSGAEAERMGLVNTAVPAAELWSEAEATADQVLQGAPDAVAAAKRAVRQAFETTLSTGLRFESEAWLVNFQSPDRLQGLSAFINRESPPWV